MKCRSATLITAARSCLHARRILVPIRPSTQSIHHTRPFCSNHLNPTPESSRHGTCLLSPSGSLRRMAAVAAYTHRFDPASRERAAVRHGMTRRSNPQQSRFQTCRAGSSCPFSHAVGSEVGRGVGGNRAYEIISRKLGDAGGQRSQYGLKCDAASHLCSQHDDATGA